jgi:regulator of protease activity HflC (stomatin/prohibitin superfamily)
MLRSVLGEVELDELLSQREKINVRLQAVLDQHTGRWGVKVTLVEVKQVDLPDQMILAIARRRKRSASAGRRSFTLKASTWVQRSSVWPQKDSAAARSH